MRPSRCAWNSRLVQQKEDFLRVLETVLIEIQIVIKTLLTAETILELWLGLCIQTNANLLGVGGGAARNHIYVMDGEALNMQSLAHS